MKKSKKIAIILAISATFGGVLSSPPERTYAADIVIDSQDKFDAILNNPAPDWEIGISDNTKKEINIYLKNSGSDNTIIYKGID